MTDGRTRRDRTRQGPTEIVADGSESGKRLRRFRNPSAQNSVNPRKVRVDDHAIRVEPRPDADRRTPGWFRMQPGAAILTCTWAVFTGSTGGVSSRTWAGAPSGPRRRVIAGQYHRSRKRV